MPNYVHGNIEFSDVNAIVAQMEQGGSDRDVCILAGTLLENALRRHLEKFIDKNSIFTGKDLWRPGQPLGTFSAKIEVARAFGLIHDVNYVALHRIKKIRNHCAHSLGVSNAETVSLEADPIRGWLLDLFSEQLLQKLPKETAEKVRESHKNAVENEPRIIFKTYVWQMCLEWLSDWDEETTYGLLVPKNRIPF